MRITWNCRKTSRKDSGRDGRTCLVPRWKASHLRYTGPRLKAAQFRRLLGFETRMQVDDFLKEHEVYDCTVEDLKQDCETLRQVRARELSIESLPVRS